MNKKVVLIFILFIYSIYLPASENQNYEYSHFFSLGGWFGGDKIATNPGGDNYNAGSGGIIEFGHAYKLRKVINIFHRNSLALRYQGAKEGDGENRGFVVESTLVKEWKKIAVGGGVHLDLFNRVKDQYGDSIELNNIIGTVVNLEYLFNEKAGVGIRYLFADFESKEGTIYKGNQFGFFVSVRYE